MRKKMNLKTRLLVQFLFVGMIPFGVISLIAYLVCSSALEDAAVNRLLASRDVAKQRVGGLFERYRTDVEGLVETAVTLRQDAFSKLDAVQELKKTEIENYFPEGLPRGQPPLVTRKTVGVPSAW